MADSPTQLDINHFKQSLLSGYHNLFNFYPEIDRLNVFPVPDGDTGVNMHLTIQSGMKNIAEVNSMNLFEMSQKFSRGLIMGARGNSGVIFSQIMRGFIKNLQDKSVITPADVPAMLTEASATAYEAVIKPVEGTILTVIRETAEYINSLPSDAERTMAKLFAEITAAAKKSLYNTPELLPILKKVNVVDSGGFGLWKFFEGMEIYIRTQKPVEKMKKIHQASKDKLSIELKPEYGYCTEAVIILNEERQQNLKIHSIRQSLIDQKCNSIVAIKDQDILKTHAHSLQPGVVLTFLQQFGEFQNVKVDNMTLQAKAHSLSFVSDRTLVNKWAIIPIVPTREIADYFRKYFKNWNAIIAGKYMNPSVETILEKVKEVDATNVFILPNNKNTILATEHAAKLEELSTVYVVPSKIVSEGMVAITQYNMADTPRKNLQNMRQAIRATRTIEIAQASKKSQLNNIKVDLNDYFAVTAGKVIQADKKIADLMKSVFKKYINKNSEIVTVLYTAQADQNMLDLGQKYLDENYDIEYVFVNAGDIISKLIISIE